MVTDFMPIETQQKHNSLNCRGTFEMLNVLLSCSLSLLIDDGLDVKVSILFPITLKPSVHTYTVFPSL